MFIIIIESTKHPYPKNFKFPPRPHFEENLGSLWHACFARKIWPKFLQQNRNLYLNTVNCNIVWTVFWMLLSYLLPLLIETGFRDKRWPERTTQWVELLVGFYDPVPIYVCMELRRCLGHYEAQKYKMANKVQNWDFSWPIDR